MMSDNWIQMKRKKCIEMGIFLEDLSDKRFEKNQLPAFTTCSEIIYMPSNAMRSFLSLSFFKTFKDLLTFKT